MNKMHTGEVILSIIYNLHCIQVPYNYGAVGLLDGQPGHTFTAFLSVR